MQLDQCPAIAAPIYIKPRAREPEPPARAAAPVMAWRLEWLKQPGPLDQHWIGRLGIMVRPAGSEPRPISLFLRDALEQLAAQLSAPAQEWRDTASVQRGVSSILQATQNVVDHPSAMPDHFAAVCAHAMLWGNFLDAAIALVDLALTGRGAILTVDAQTLGIIAPRAYSRRRALIPDAEACLDFYSVPGPDRADRGWQTYTEDGDLAPTVLWGLMNAFNCQFPGPAAAGKEKMRAWCARTTRRFLGSLQRESITTEELSALTSSW